MPTKKSKSNTVKKVSPSSSKSKPASLKRSKPVTHPLLFLVLIAILSLVVTLVYFSCQNYKHLGLMIKDRPFETTMDKKQTTDSEYRGPKVVATTTTWVWDMSDKFVLKFNSDGTFSSTTDCNGVSGKYVFLGAKKLNLTDMASTLMYCEKSLEAGYVANLASVTSYTLEGDKLTLMFGDDNSSLMFTKRSN